jgi:hypothetical protein
MKNEKQRQQGDVLFKKVDAIPAGAKRTNNHILAAGEHTGHNHELSLLDMASGEVEVYDTQDGFKFVKNSSDKPVTVTHPEHKQVTVPPGIWQLDIVREKDWFTEMERRVQD